MRHSWCDECWACLVVYKRMPPNLAKEMSAGTLLPYWPARPTVFDYNSAPSMQHKILVGGAVKSVATIAMAPPVTDGGEFTGYASTWRHQGGPDRQGDVIAPGAFTKWVGQVNSGAVIIPIVAGGESGHSDAPMAVVGRVMEAGQDQTGLWIRASMTGDADAQLLRQKMKSGALAGLSIGYSPGKERYITLPDGTAARELDQVDVYHIALTPIPANPSAQVTGVKGVGARSMALPGRVVTVQQAIAEDAARRDPDRDRIRREDAMLAAASWPPQGTFDRKTALALMRGAAVAEAARAPVDDGERLAVERREADNRYCNGLAAWMAAHR